MKQIHKSHLPDFLIKWRRLYWFMGALVALYLANFVAFVMIAWTAKNASMHWASLFIILYMAVKFWLMLENT